MKARGTSPIQKIATMLKGESEYCAGGFVLFQSLVSISRPVAKKRPGLFFGHSQWG